VKGTLRGYHYGEGKWYTLDDFCKNPIELGERNCFPTTNEPAGYVTSYYDCPHGCQDGACNLPPGKTTVTCDPIIPGRPKIPPGRRVKNQQQKLVYCAFDLTYQPVKSIGEECGNDFECKSNVCIDGDCTSISAELKKQTNLLQEILCFLKSIFTSETYEECLGEFAGGGYHEFDTNQNYIIEYFELDSAMQQYNNEEITVEELSRIITFVNAGGYHVDSSTSDGFAPNVEPGLIADSLTCLDVDFNCDGLVTPADAQEVFDLWQNGVVIDANLVTSLTKIGNIVMGCYLTSQDYITSPQSGTTIRQFIYPPSSSIGSIYVTAEDLCGVVSGATGIHKLVEDHWSGHGCGGLNNFNLRKGEGYLIHTPNEVTFELEGYQEDTVIINMRYIEDTVNLHEITLPNSWDGKTAEDLCETMSGANTIVRRVENHWEYHPCGESVNNFILNKNLVYTIGISEDVFWDPSIVV